MSWTTLPHEARWERKDSRNEAREDVRLAGGYWLLNYP
jgi:hypothetical protein